MKWPVYLGNQRGQSSLSLSGAADCSRVETLSDNGPVSSTKEDWGCFSFFCVHLIGTYLFFLYLELATIEYINRMFCCNICYFSFNSDQWYPKEYLNVWDILRQSKMRIPVCFREWVAFRIASTRADKSVSRCVRCTWAVNSRQAVCYFSIIDLHPFNNYYTIQGVGIIIMWSETLFPEAYVWEK